MTKNETSTAADDVFVTWLQKWWLLLQCNYGNSVTITILLAWHCCKQNVNNQRVEVERCMFNNEIIKEIAKHITGGNMADAFITINWQQQAHQCCQPHATHAMLIFMNIIYYLHYCSFVLCQSVYRLKALGKACNLL